MALYGDRTKRKNLASIEEIAKAALAKATSVEQGNVADGDYGDVQVSSGVWSLDITGTLASYLTTATAATTYQPLSSNLTAWSAVAPGSYLTTAAASAAYQPLDSDLTAIAALTTTTYGRSLLTGADAAATRTALGLGTLATQSGTFSGTSSGTNTGDQTITLTGNVTGSGTGSFPTTIANSAVTLAMMANVATGSVFYRKTAGSGVPEVQTLGTLKTDLGLTGTNSGDQTITLTGDVTGSGTGSFAATIANDAVTYAKMQNVSATARLLGRITAGAGDTEELTGTQATTLLDAFTTSLKGLAPASGGGTTNFLRADGSWAVPSGGGAARARGYGSYTSNADLTTAIPLDDTIPQITEGTEVATATITPSSASNRVRITVSLFGSRNTTAQYIIAAVFRDAVANALFAEVQYISLSLVPWGMSFTFENAPATTSAITYRLRVGGDAGTIRLNGTMAARYFGGVAATTIVVEEIAP